MKHQQLLLFAILAVLCTSLNAQPVNKIYVGVKAGPAWGTSTFSSFGADKTRWGVGGAVFGGYRLSPAFSVELSAGYSSLSMSAVKCCENLWLCPDGSRYYAPILGEQSWRYGNLASSISLFNVGAHFNVSLLPAFGVDSRFVVEVSPAIYWASSSASVKEISGNQTVFKTGTGSHFGAGGDLTLGYRVTNSIVLGVYGGGVWYSGKAFDAMPRVEHKGNCTINTGIKLTYSFGRKKNSRKSVQAPTQIVPIQVQTPKTEPVENKTEKPALTQERVTVDVLQPVVEKKEESIQNAATTPAQLLPTIYYGFNEVLIPESELAKLRQIADVLKADPTMKVELRGWCDNVGTRKANRKVSVQRAIELRYRLIKHGVAGNRITVKGMGEDTSVSSADSARRVETIEKQAK